jgi:hypothetical protein
MIDADGERLELEHLAVRNWRYDEARKAGLSPVEALMFSDSDRDLGELRKLIAKGCPLETIRAIVL